MMGPKLAYADKLKDPRWQKKRLEVFEKAKWQCACCGGKDETLHVHHLEYGDEPWATADEFLECLCESCHEAREQANRLLSEQFRGVSTKLVEQFAQNVAILTELFKTAPEHLQADGLPNFIITFVNHGLDKFFEDSPRVQVTESSYRIFSDKTA